MKTAATQIAYDEPSGFEPNNNNNTRCFDGLLPQYGWVALEQTGPTSVRLLHDDDNEEETFLLPVQTAELYSRSFRAGDEELKAGQGICFWDDFVWKRGIVVNKDTIALLEGGSGGKVTLQMPRDLTRIGPISHASRAGVAVVEMEGDGNCLYRAASHQVYGTPEHHALVRQACCDFIELEQAYFEPFFNEGFSEHLQAMRRTGTWGDDPELQALAEIYEANVLVVDFAHPHRVIKRIDSAAAVAAGKERRRICLCFDSVRQHYDAIAQQQQEQFPPMVGAMEQHALEICKLRRAGGETKAKLESDVWETERIQLEECETLAALEQSDHDATTQEEEEQILAQAMQDSLEEMLLDMALEESRYL